SRRPPRLRGHARAHPLRVRAHAGPLRARPAALRAGGTRSRLRAQADLAVGRKRSRENRGHWLARPRQAAALVAGGQGPHGRPRQPLDRTEVGQRMTPFHLRQRLARVLLADSPDDAIAYCRGLVRKSRSNFSYAFLFLPPDQKEALEAVYAFCRVVDDAVDEAGDAAALAKWRAELAQAFGGQPQTPVGKQLAVAARAFPIRRADLERVLEGVEMDLRKLRFATWTELRDYCEHVASAVGLVCLE